MIAFGQPTLTGNERKYVNDALDNNRLSMGYWVARFEREFADYIGAKYAIAVSNGTEALHLALLALGVGPGDEVIVPAITFVATANAVTYTGAKPVIVDVDPDTWTMDKRDAYAAFSRKTKAIVPVHLYGVPADMKTLSPSAQHTPIVEDAAEALGATHNELKIGRFGELTCFSFYGNKIVTTGEGGMITMWNDDLARKIHHLRGQGQTDKRYWHDVIGYNCRMTDIQAAIGVAQLEQIQTFLDIRARVFDSYYSRLKDIVTFQKRHSGDDPAVWAVAVQLPYDVHKTGVIEEMAARGIETRPVFYPLNHFPMYCDEQYHTNAEQIHRRGLVLPTHAALTDSDVAEVCDKLKEAMRHAEHA